MIDRRKLRTMARKTTQGRKRILSFLNTQSSREKDKRRKRKRWREEWEEKLSGIRKDTNKGKLKL